MVYKCGSSQEAQESYLDRMVDLILSENELEDDEDILAIVEGYYFEIHKEDDEVGNWYIQVSPVGESYLYDGFWPYSEDKTAREAVKEAITGSEIFNTGFKKYLD